MNPSWLLGDATEEARVLLKPRHLPATNYSQSDRSPSQFNCQLATFYLGLTATSQSLLLNNGESMDTFDEFLLFYTPKLSG